MGHEELKQVGITAYGHRHRLIKGIEKLLTGPGKLATCYWLSLNLNFVLDAATCCPSGGTVLAELSPEDQEYRAVEEEVWGYPVKHLTL